MSRVGAFAEVQRVDRTGTPCCTPSRVDALVLVLRTGSVWGVLSKGSVRTFLRIFALGLAGAVQDLGGARPVTTAIVGRRKSTGPNLGALARGGPIRQSSFGDRFRSSIQYSACSRSSRFPSCRMRCKRPSSISCGNSSLSTSATAAALSASSA